MYQYINLYSVPCGSLLFLFIFFLNVRRNSRKSAWKTWAHSLLWEHPHFYFSERKNNEEMAEVVDGVSRCVACYKTILASQHLRHCPVKATVGNTRLLSDWPRVLTTLQPGVGGKWKLPPHLPPMAYLKTTAWWEVTAIGQCLFCLFFFSSDLFSR